MIRIVHVGHILYKSNVYLLKLLYKNFAKVLIELSKRDYTSSQRLLRCVLILMSQLLLHINVSFCCKNPVM